MTKSQLTTWLLALLLVPLLAMGLRLWGLNTSETWDEVAYYDAAHDYYQNVIHDRWQDATAWVTNREHPAVAKWLYLAVSLDPIKRDVADFNPGRLLSAALGSLTVLLTMLLGRKLFDWRVGILAGLTLALLPSVIGLNRVLGLDTPWTFFFTLSIWAFVEAITSRAKRHGSQVAYSLPTWLWHVIALVAFGLCMGTRLTGVLLWPILTLIAIIARVTSHESRVTSWSGFVSRISYLVSRFRSALSPSNILLVLAYLVIPPLIVFGTWPWLWHDTAAHWQITWGHWSPVTNYFLGVIQDPGPGYYAIYFLASFPALFVILSILWLARALTRGSRSDLILFVIVAGVFAFSAYGLRQGGFRYLMGLTPALAIAVSAYVTELADGMQDRRAIWLLPAIFVIYLIPHALLYQPYQLDYYNELTGGTKVIEQGKWLQVGWWGEGINEAVDWLNQHAEPKASLSFTALPDRAQRLLRKDFHHTLGRPEYILTNPAFAWYRSEYPTLDEYRLVYAVRAHDAVIAGVWRRTAQSPALAPTPFAH